jgi:hypothetical protein
LTGINLVKRFHSRLVTGHQVATCSVMECRKSFDLRFFAIGLVLVAAIGLALNSLAAGVGIGLSLGIALGLAKAADAS